MSAKEIKGEDYLVQSFDDKYTIYFSGELALRNPSEYAPINDCLLEMVEQHPQTMTLDLRELAFLNSSGISMLSKFVLSMRKQKGIQLVVLGSSEMPWQSKSLKNLQKFLPGLKLEVN